MQCVVIIVVVVLLVASALMRWLLCGEKMRVQKKKNNICNCTLNYSRENFLLRLQLTPKKRPAIKLPILRFLRIHKQKTRDCNHFRPNGGLLLLLSASFRHCVDTKLRTPQETWTRLRGTPQSRPRAPDSTQTRETDPITSIGARISCAPQRDTQQHHVAETRLPESNNNHVEDALLCSVPAASSQQRSERHPTTNERTTVFRRLAATRNRSGHK